MRNRAFYLWSDIIQTQSLSMEDYEQYFIMDEVRMNQQISCYLDLQKTIGSDCLSLNSFQQDIQKLDENKTSSSLSIEITTDQQEPNITNPDCFASEEQLSLSQKNEVQGIDDTKRHRNKTKSKTIKKIEGLTKKRQQYPTKNFLQNFKAAHYDYLCKTFTKQQLSLFPIIDNFQGKKSVSRTIYQDLYLTPEFEESFEQMFKEKFLYRYMMRSRSGIKSKKNHVGKIVVLEKAFRSKKFLKIN